MNLLKKKNKKVKVEIFSKKDCHLCEEAKAVLLKFQKEYDFEIDEVDIEQNSELFETYKEQIPVLFINGRKAFKFRIEEQKLRRKLQHL